VALSKSTAWTVGQKPACVRSPKKLLRWNFLHPCYLGHVGGRVQKLLVIFTASNLFLFTQPLCVAVSTIGAETWESK